MNLEFLIDWPAGGRLARDYVSGADTAERFFPHPFRDPSALGNRAAALDAWFTHERRAQAARVLVASNPPARDRIEAWREGEGLVVTTGQQPGLFTGPLFAIHKAVTAMALARRWEAALGRPVLPVFWVASEDHDWEESSHTYLLGAEYEAVRVEAQPVAEPAGRALSRVEIRPPSSTIDLPKLIPSQGFGSDCLTQIRDAYPAGATLPDGFAALLSAWLGPLGLCVVRADQPDLKRTSQGLLLREAREGAATQAALERRAADLAASEYDVQVPILDGGLNLFLEGGAGRERLYREGDGFRLQGSEELLSRAQLEQRCRTDPSVLSPNVLLRPVVESSVFPVLAYVAGPGELGYWAQLHPLFEHLGVPMPIVHPRLSVTIIEPKVRQLLDKTGMTIAELARPEHELAHQLARDELPEAANATLHDVRAQIEAGMSALLDAVRHIDPTLAGPLNGARISALNAVGMAENKILKALKKETRIELDRVLRARHQLVPLGKPQDRVLNVIQFLSRYGAGLFDALLHECEAALDAEGSVALPSRSR